MTGPGLRRDDAMRMFGVEMQNGCLFCPLES